MDASLPPILSTLGGSGHMRFLKKNLLSKSWTHSSENMVDIVPMPFFMGRRKRPGKINCVVSVSLIS